MATANGVRKTMAEISKNFPTGLEYRIVDDPTVFIQESVNAVPHTLLEAFALVFMIVLIFLQAWRTTLLIAKGAGAEMRQALGTSVFSGILGVTFFGLVLTPVFYVVIRWFIERKHRKIERQHEKQAVAPATHIMLMLMLVPALLGLVNGCKAVGPDYSEPAVPVPTEFANQEQPGMSPVAVEVACGVAFRTRS